MKLSLQSKAVFFFFFFIVADFLFSQQYLAFPVENEELEARKKDILRAGISLGGRFFNDDVADFENSRYPNATIINDLEDQGLGLSVRLGITYGLDHYLLPGISIGLQVDYSFVDISDISLRATDSGNVAYNYNGAFLSSQNFGIVPALYVRTFPLVEYLFTTDLPPSWDIYFYGGARFNFHLFKESKLELKGLEDLTLGWETGIGIEIFLDKRISLHLEYSYYTDTSDLKVTQQNATIFKGELKFDASRIMVGMYYYF